MTATACSFCDRLTAESPQERLQRDSVVAYAESSPHAEGHMVVIPRRHVPRLIDLTEEEHAALFALMRDVAGYLEDALAPDGFTIGMNDGPAAGQATPHVHVHVVPRWHGDVEDPRGGIRRALPPRIDR